MTVADFYRKRRVMITGLTGFKGIWLASWLERLGAHVTGLALPPTQAMARGWPGMLQRFPCALGDIRNEELVHSIVRQSRPELIFHLAAQPLVRKSYQIPAETFATNIQGTVHVLDAARHTASVRGVVVVTSDKCYENREHETGFREEDPLGGHDPYSASKACAEIVAQAYQRSFGDERWRVATARAGNVIGGGDWAADRLVPDFVRSLLVGAPCLVRRPMAVRPWQHVLEPLAGYLMLGERLLSGNPEFASSWNFGPPDEEAFDVRTLVRHLIGAWRDGRALEAETEAGPHEARLLRLDSAKARNRLGWQPLLDPKERIAWTAAAYRAWHERPAAMWDVVDRQILAYEERMDAWLGRKLPWSPASTASSARPSHAA